MSRIFVDSPPSQACLALKQGGVVAFPTETVYGLGADAAQPQAIKRVFELKQRPVNHPVIVHIDTPEKAHNIAGHIPQAFWLLAQAFWPGPLTIILDKSDKVSPLITGGHSTVGIRIPNHPATLALLKEFELGLIGPSANPFGRISPTCSKHVVDYFGDTIDGVLEGGACEVGIESSVIYLQEDAVHFLRQGMISEDEIRKLVPHLKLQKNSKTASPGTHKKHYAPSTTMHVVAKEDLQQCADHFESLGKTVCGFGLSPCNINSWIKMPSQPSAYAQKVYAVLHDLDSLDCDIILCERLPQTQEWHALADRIDRAAITMAKPKTLA